MNTYEAGRELAINDVRKFGILLAMDKLVLFDGEFADGYHDGIATAPNLTSPAR